MAYKVLVVDDSSFFRRRVSDIINSDSNLTVIDVAVNGIEAVEKAKELKPDVITMDIEMPLLNGIEAVKQIMATAPTSILMFSSLTHQGAKSTLEALDAGALDFLPKKFNEIAKTSGDAGSVLKQRVLELARKKTTSFTRPVYAKSVQLNKSVENKRQAPREVVEDSAKATNRPLYHHKVTDKQYKLLAIGTSTGGPVALQKILTQLPENFPLPIVMVQHMPAAFTKAFASRLDSLCKISVKEAEDGDILKAGCAYLAPGGKQMVLEGKANNTKVKVLDDNSSRIAFKPSVDITFGSASKVFSDNVLAIILTGMGSDGRDGSRMLKNNGSIIWSQDEESCVVYGMPQAVANAGISSLSLPLLEFPKAILKELKHT
ncbi:chemotaxis response regulator protein-glutamate methylesterase [Colwelliaceae bacterium 6441]